MCPVTLTVWFLCKSCKLNFAKVDDYIEHKKENHFTEFQAQNMSCIVFEEKIDQYTDNESGLVETTPIVLKEEFQLVDDSQIEINSDVPFGDPELPFTIADITAKTINYCCNSKSNKETLVSKTELVTECHCVCIEEAKISEAGSVQQNPYVLVKRLTLKEIHGASRATKPNWNLKNHLKSQLVQGPFKCLIPNCGKEYGSRSALIIHCTRSHSNARPFGCPQCDKTYKFRHYLVEHLRMHTGERPFKCPVDKCNKAFAKRFTLRKHKIVVHRIYSEKTTRILLEEELQVGGHKEILKKHPETRCIPGPFKCNQLDCGKLFKAKEYLLEHLKRHSGVRPFGCPQCNKTFKHRNELVDHLTLHTGERP